MSRVRNHIKRIFGVNRAYDSLVRLFDWQLIKHSRKEAQNIEKELQNRALSETAEYVEQKMMDVKSHSNKFNLIDAALDMTTNDGLYLEFGVWEGNTINYIASKINRTIYGFDSFEGLPEDWRDGFEKGRFKVTNSPKVKNNVNLKKGWFEDSLPKFLKEHQEYFAFVHVDCDLYSSTKTIFDLSECRIKKGTILLFDEYFNYPGWRNGEYQAFQEFCKMKNVEYEYIGYCKYSAQAAVKILKISTE